MSRRSKDRAAGILVNANSNEKLLRALQKSSKKYRKSLIPLLNKVTEPGSANKLTKLIQSVEKQQPKMISPETALALISSCGLSQDDYQTIKNVAKTHHANIFPSYHKVLEAKKQCYPENIQINETTAQQPLQYLLEHTTKRLVSVNEIKETIFGKTEPGTDSNVLGVDLELSCKWGFDGATGQSQYKQRFLDDISDDKSLFSVMLVPLELKYGNVFIYK